MRCGRQEGEMTPPIRLKEGPRAPTKHRNEFDVILQAGKQGSYSIASCNINGIQCVPDRKEGVKGAKGKWKSVSPTAAGQNKGKRQRVEESHLPHLSSSL